MIGTFKMLALMVMVLSFGGSATYILDPGDEPLKFSYPGERGRIEIEIDPSASREELVGPLSTPLIPDQCIIG
ncbi:MAG: hypothetical protein JW986_00800 [Methanotrichaceae archaeon]|nr:hypothetical protein [Methanotrichaceae archaeon]